MKITIVAQKNEFKFVNARVNKGYDTLENIHVIIDQDKVTFEASDTFILVKKSFTPNESPLGSYMEPFSACIDHKFFKYMTTLSAQQSSIVLSFDTEEMTLTGTIGEFSVTTKLIDKKFPNSSTIKNYTPYTSELVLTKRVLEKMLKSIEDHVFIQIKFNDKREPISVRTSDDVDFEDQEDKVYSPVCYMMPVMNKRNDN
jgi:hypothetical protein